MRTPTPSERAATSSSREPRRRSPSPVLWKTKPATIAISAQIIAAFLLVVTGSPESPAAPFVTCRPAVRDRPDDHEHARRSRARRRCPFSRISGIANAAATSAATTPPISVAPTLPKCVSRDEFRQVGLEDRLLVGRDHEQPRGVGADRGEADAAEREDAGVADEDVEPDDEDQVDQRDHDDALRHRAAGRPGDLRDHDDEQRAAPAAARQHARLPGCARASARIKPGSPPSGRRSGPAAGRAASRSRPRTRTRPGRSAARAGGTPGAATKIAPNT